MNACLEQEAQQPQDKSADRPKQAQQRKEWQPAEQGGCSCVTGNHERESEHEFIGRPVGQGRARLPQ